MSPLGTWPLKGRAGGKEPRLSAARRASSLPVSFPEQPPKAQGAGASDFFFHCQNLKGSQGERGQCLYCRGEIYLFIFWLLLLFWSGLLGLVLLYLNIC